MIAEFHTEGRKLNSAVIWDKIIQSKDDSLLNLVKQVIIIIIVIISSFSTRGI